MPDSLPHVLFVCVENSCRSQMAEGFRRLRDRIGALVGGILAPAERGAGDGLKEKRP